MSWSTESGDALLSPRAVDGASVTVTCRGAACTLNTEAGMTYAWDVRRPRAVRTTRGARTSGPLFVSFPVPGLSLRLAPSSCVVTSASYAYVTLTFGIIHTYLGCRWSDHQWSGSVGVGKSSHQWNGSVDVGELSHWQNGSIEVGELNCVWNAGVECKCWP
jgi:hypothetical protein